MDAAIPDDTVTDQDIVRYLILCSPYFNPQSFKTVVDGLQRTSWRSTVERPDEHDYFFLLGNIRKEVSMSFHIAILYSRDGKNHRTISIIQITL